MVFSPCSNSQTSPYRHLHNMDTSLLWTVQLVQLVPENLYNHVFNFYKPLRLSTIDAYTMGTFMGTGDVTAGGNPMMD